ncbi:MAG: hypothetical protein ACTSP4_07410 [Candidatus Hodarchaeales archaeon]
MCKKCHNYVMKFPCPHCGASQSLIERDKGEIKSIIPEELQFNWKDTVYRDKNGQLIKEVKQSIFPRDDFYQIPKSEYGPVKVGQNLPLEQIFPPALTDVPLTATEQKVYLQLSIEFQIILDGAKNYRDGMYRWSLLLPDRLQEYGLTTDVWERIAKIGDSDPRMQEILRDLMNKIG